MSVKINFLICSNPFIDAYIHSDLLGKLIFVGLVLLSIFTWVIVIHKAYWTSLARKNSKKFYQAFNSQRVNPLAIDCDPFKEKKDLNPFVNLYQVLKRHTIDILNKNRLFGVKSGEISKETPTSYLSASDIDIVGSYLQSTIANQTKYLEKNLFILSTIVSLAPFLGLLGTVWGILTTFSELQAQSASNTLGGLSLALATTVLGLVDAIPALIGYNYLKNTIRDFEIEMEGFSTEILASVEMQYRKVES